MAHKYLFLLRFLLFQSEMLYNQYTILKSLTLSHFELAPNPKAWLTATTENES